MGLDTTAYARGLRALLPPGPAWQAGEGSVLFKLLLGFAEELARLDRRVNDLLNEMDPRTTSELLAEWERALGIPDLSVSYARDFNQRRATVYGAITAAGGQSEAFFIDLALRMGFVITISDYAGQAFQVGKSRVGETLRNGPWAYTWQVNGASFDVISVFRAGSQAGDPLKEYGEEFENEPLEIAILARKPAHTHVIFSYAA